jgi:membrane fusion protein
VRGRSKYRFGLCGSLVMSRNSGLLDRGEATVLFRREAVAHAARRLQGDVMLAAPLPARLIGFVLTAIVLAATAFAGLATYSRKAAVTGWLVPDHGFIRASAPAGGLIANLFVMEGDAVEEGQRLAEIRVAAEIAGGNAGAAMAEALRDEAAAINARGAAQIAKLEAEEPQTQTRLDNLRIELAYLEQQATLQDRRVAIAETAAAEVETASPGSIAKREMEQRRSTALMAEQELVTLRRQAAGIKRDIADLAARLIVIPIEIAATRADTQAAGAGLTERASEAEQRHAVFVLAPVAGHVAALPVAAGQPLAPNATLAVITPLAGRLEAELLAPSRAAGFIELGQEVRLQLQAFPYQRFGMVRGTIKTVSTTVLGPTEISIPGLAIQEPIFRVRVALSREAVDAYGKSYPLQPGMLLGADIVFDRRRLLQWLFDPLYAVGRRA